MANDWLKESKQHALFKLKKAFVSPRFGSAAKFVLLYLTWNILSDLWLNLCGRLDKGPPKCPCANPQNLGICYFTKGTLQV